MKKSFGLVASIVFVAAVFVVVFFSVGAVGCKMTEAGVELYSREVSSPQIVSFTVENENELRLECTKTVSVSDLKISGIENAEFEVSGKNVLLTIPEGTKVGKTYVLEGVVYDVDGSSLTFALSFIGYNGHPAQIAISEIRSERNKSESKKNGITFKDEYVEFLVLKSGNLSGLELVAGSDGEDKKYAFPAIDVERGEFVVVHCRNEEQEINGMCVDEVTGDKTLSGATDSSDDAWDLWIDNKDARIGKNDVVVLRDSFSGNLLDAVLYCESGKKWSKPLQSELAEKAVEAGLWKGEADVSSAADSSKASYTKSLCRSDLAELLENGFTAGSKDVWILAASKPGKKTLTFSE